MGFAEPSKVRRTVKDCKGVKMHNCQQWVVLQALYPKKIRYTPGSCLWMPLGESEDDW